MARFFTKGARIRPSLHRKDGKLSPLFVSMDDREEGVAFIWRDGEQSLTRFPHRGSRRNIYENVSSLSSLSYLPFLQIVSISAYSKFSNRHLRLPSNVRDLSNFPIAVRRDAGFIFYTQLTHAHPPFHSIPNFLISPLNRRIHFKFS